MNAFPECNETGSVDVVIIQFVDQMPNKVDSESARGTFLQLGADVDFVALPRVEKLGVAIGQGNGDVIPFDRQFDRDFRRARAVVADHVREDLLHDKLNHENEGFILEAITRKRFDKLENAIELTDFAPERGLDRDGGRLACRGRQGVAFSRKLDRKGAVCKSAHGVASAELRPAAPGGPL
jgi:hypothetical protein